MATGISFASINSSLVEMTKAADTSFNTAMETFKEANKTGAITTAQTIAMQQEMQKWTFSYDIAAKANERLGDLLKSIAQKS